jgi:hypothetical protein
VTNKLMEELFPMIEGTHGMRAGLLDVLSDADLAFTPGGQAMPLGQLLVEFGEIEQAYVDSFKTLKQDFSWRQPDASLAGSLEAIRAWYHRLDHELRAVLGALSDADLQKTIDRGSFQPTVEVQLQIYLQALLIFFGKATIYLRVMQRPLPKAIESWIG